MAEEESRSRYKTYHEEPYVVILIILSKKFGPLSRFGFFEEDVCGDRQRGEWWGSGGTGELWPGVWVEGVVVQERDDFREF